MNSALDWDEFRLVKAIADARSLVGAAEALGLNHSTIFRRLGAIETAIGARLFERSRAGYQPTAAGEEMIALADRDGRIRSSSSSAASPDATSSRPANCGSRRSTSVAVASAAADSSRVFAQSIPASSST